MADLKYNNGKAAMLGDGTDAIDFENDTIKAVLVTAAYTPNADTHQYYSDITNEVANGNGYTTGGQALANKAVTQDDTGDKAVFDSDDPTWASASFTARAVILYKDTGTGSTSPLIGYWDFGADKVSSGGSFVVQVNAAGWLDLT
jgi:hypothetical protein